jgi:hypothetical protein
MSFGPGSFSQASFSALAWKIQAAPVVDEESPRIQSGACFPFGSADLIRIRRKKRRRETDLLFLGR